MFVYMTLWYFVAKKQKRLDVVDTAWGLGFIVVVITNLSIFEINIQNPRTLLVTTMVTIWGLRLAFHLWLRNKNKPEDYRYKNLQKNAFLKVFMVQGVLLILISLQNIIIINTPNQAPLNITDLYGVIIWLVGMFFEALGDYQLFVHKQSKSTKILDYGLWKYTRHPNYFGEVAVWWGIYLLALNTPFGLIALISPLTITYLIVALSGIPLLEEKLSKNPKYKKYMTKTSMLIPLPPRQ